MKSRVSPVMGASPAGPCAALAAVGGLAVDGLPSAQECCGFGGLFAAKYPEVSARIADAFLGDQGLDQVDAGVERAVQRVRALDAEQLRHAVVVLREAVVAHAAVAARRGVRNPIRLEHHDPRAFARQHQRRGQAGEARADHDDIRLAFGRPLRCSRERRRGVEPVRSEFHGRQTQLRPGDGWHRPS